MLIPFIISTLLLIVSEIMPFVPNKYNGFIHSFYICLLESKKLTTSPS